MDYQAVLFDPIYLIQGVPAVITLDPDFVSEFPSESESDDGVLSVTVIDKTSGIDLSFGEGNVQNIVPAACVRMKELTALGLDAEMLVRSAITFNDATWTIKSVKPKPSLKGEADGELFLILTGRS